MKVSFTAQSSREAHSKLDIIIATRSDFKAFFSDKVYGDDLASLLIGVCCVSPESEEFFKPKKPKYRKEAETYEHKSVNVHTPDNHLVYELRLPFAIYMSIDDIRSDFAERVLESLSVISTIKKIKDFDLERFRADFRICFQQLGWLPNE